MSISLVSNQEIAEPIPLQLSRREIVFSVLISPLLKNSILLRSAMQYGPKSN